MVLMGSAVGAPSPRRVRTRCSRGGDYGGNSSTDEPENADDAHRCGVRREERLDGEADHGENEEARPTSERAAVRRPTGVEPAHTPMAQPTNTMSVQTLDR